MDYIYGRHAVLSVLKNPKRQVKSVSVQRDLPHDSILEEIRAVSKGRKVLVEEVGKTKLEKKHSLSGKSHQGVAAITSEYEYVSLDELRNGLGKDCFLLILDHVNDPHNLGAIIRSAEMSKVDGIIIPKDKSVGITNTVVKTSAGASERIAVALVSNINEAVRKLKKQDIWVYGLEVGGNVIYFENLNLPLALVVGSEGKGLSRLTRELCDNMVTIPTFGQTGSLNVSVAAGVAMFERLRQKHYA